MKNTRFFSIDNYMKWSDLNRSMETISGNHRQPSIHRESIYNVDKSNAQDRYVGNRDFLKSSLISKVMLIFRIPFDLLQR